MADADGIRLEECGTCVVCGDPIERSVSPGPKPKVCGPECKRERERTRGARREGRALTVVTGPKSASVEKLLPEVAGAISDALAIVGRTLLAARMHQEPDYEEAFEALLSPLHRLSEALPAAPHS